MFTYDDVIMGKPHIQRAPSMMITNRAIMLTMSMADSKKCNNEGNDDDDKDDGNHCNDDTMIFMIWWNITTKWSTD